MQVYAVYGASGFGREVMPLLRDAIQKRGIDLKNLYFVDDNPPSDCLNGHNVITYSDFIRLEGCQKYVTVAIADSAIRKLLSERCISDGVEILDVKADNIVILDEVSIGPGAILAPFVTLTSNISIGKSFHANIYSYVGHDCVIGDYVTFAPSVKCNGNIVIEDYAYIGTGAVIKQGRPDKPLVIGKGAVVGMGAVVTKNVAEGTVVFGNPAKLLSRKK